jgi:hypothetical protein
MGNADVNRLSSLQRRNRHDCRRWSRPKVRAERDDKRNPSHVACCQIAPEARYLPEKTGRKGVGRSPSQILSLCPISSRRVGNISSIIMELSIVVHVCHSRERTETRPGCLRSQHGTFIVDVIADAHSGRSKRQCQLWAISLRPSQRTPYRAAGGPEGGGGQRGVVDVEGAPATGGAINRSASTVGGRGGRGRIWRRGRPASSTK